MPIEITTHFAFRLENPTNLLLQFQAAALPEQQIIASDTWLTMADQTTSVPAHGGIGERIWVHANGEFVVDYTAKIEVNREVPDLATLDAVSPADLPGGTVEYVFDSRYCEAGRMQHFVEERFGTYSGGAKIAAMRDWIADQFSYVPGASNASTTALESFAERRGICRDFAHVMICLARAATIPARFVSCYAPGVSPPDFHAVAEVFLSDPNASKGGAWYLVDPTGMADPAKTAKIGIGRDAADVSFLTTFGLSEFLQSRVTVRDLG